VEKIVPRWLIAVQAIDTNREYRYDRLLQL